MRVRHHQQRVAIGRAFGNCVRADDRTGTRTIVDNEILPQRILQTLAANGTMMRTGFAG
jgi:hypothetical protein